MIDSFGVFGRAGTVEQMPLLNQADKARKGAAYVNSGALRVLKGGMTPQPSFLDYIAGGCELNFMVSGGEGSAMAL